MNSNTYSRFKILGAFAFGLLLLCACQSNQEVGTLGIGGNTAASASGSPSASATPGASASVDAEMYFKIDTSWDQNNATLTHWSPLLVDGTIPSVSGISACSLPRGSAPGTDSLPAVTHTCNFHIPEAQLYYSKTNFIYGSNDYTNCKYMRFYPYFYAVNSSATPPPPATTPTPAAVNAPFTLGAVVPVNCYGFVGGVSPRPAFPEGVIATEPGTLYSSPECYNGAGTAVPGFLTRNIGLIVQTQTAQEFNFQVDSGFDLNKSSNRWISNDTANAGAAGASYTDEYLLNSMHGYTLQCLNEFGVLTYEMSITITADHTTGPPAAIYKSWR